MKSEKEAKNILKIAYFSDTFYPQINGVVSSLINLARSLADKGHKIYIVAPKVDKDFEEFSYPGITILRISSVKASFYEDFRWAKIISLKTYKVLKDADIDVIHFETPIGLGIMAINMARLLNTPLVGTYHTFISDPRYIKHWKLFKPTVLLQNISWFYSNQFYNRTDLTTAPSQSTIVELKENGCNPPLMKTISNGIDPAIFDNSRSDEVRKTYGLEGKTILYVGRIAHEKSIDILLTAFFKAAEIDGDMKIMIVGHGPQMDDIKEMIDRSPYKSRIILTGAIPHDELVVSGIYGACEVFATASETENQPMTILEAQVNGCVCVGVDARGVPGMIENGQSGIIVEKGDTEAMARAFLTILGSEEKLSSMKNKTLENVKEHFLPSVVEQWEREYRALISGFKGRYFKDKLFYPFKKAGELLSRPTEISQE
ncbi:glycosyltransferase [Spirochaeta isovalerica]|uniref:Glycosyltransferase involved in cell wall biosynthesis n=1 Tax=Spirochaeta isovalerica TaxID=150 RepID=A0A841R5E7_9SPIO|nr:glycosyltransferase [Spirochaeta isovalerica]MBB6479085.1 glycosyltransferase involved in cell wall biosynthesis [Spirochaeta isovalerica]